MNVLNIHGYKGSSCNSAYTALKSIGCEVISPEIGFDILTPQKIIDNLRNQIFENKIDVIVGTSLGGFYAIVLSAQLNLSVILVNPCLMPFLYLPQLGYSGDVKQYMTLFGEILKLNDDNVNTIVGCEDEIIDTELTKSILQNSRYREIPNGKHSGSTLPLKDFFTEILCYIETMTRDK